MAIRLMTLSLQILNSLPTEVRPDRVLVKFDGQLAYTLFPEYSVELYEPNFDTSLVQTGEIAIEFVGSPKDVRMGKTKLPRLLYVNFSAGLS